jgi:hypothetical protein
VVASFFVGSAPDIRAAFGVPTIAETVIYKRAGGETEFWNTAVTLGTEIQFKWWRWPLAPVLRELALRLDTNGQITDLREVLQRRTP